MLKFFKITLLLILSIAKVSYTFGQTNGFEGLVIDKTSKEPIPFVSVELYNNTDFLKTRSDFDGKFSFQNSTAELYKTKLPSLGYIKLDTSINIINSPKLTFQLTTSPPIPDSVYSQWLKNRTSALKDIKKAEPKLYLPGGFVSAKIFAADTIFEKKYKIEFISPGCTSFIGDDYKAYNQTIFKYLDRKYKKKWRKEIRKDVIGFKEYIK